MEHGAAAAVVRRKRAAGPELRTVHPDLVRSGEIADMDAHGLLEQVTFVAGEKRRIYLHPGAVPCIPAGKGGRMDFGSLALPRDRHHAPVGSVDMQQGKKNEAG